MRNSPPSPEELVFIAARFRDFMQALGLDVESEHLRDTPRRVATLYAYEMLNPTPFTFTTFEAKTQSLVAQLGVSFASVCSHSWLPLTGVVHIGYVPDKRLAGPLELVRTVDYCSRKPHVQEQLTIEIADMLTTALMPAGLAVIVETDHVYVSLRGAHNASTTTVTSEVRGTMLDQPDQRAEFVSVIDRWAR